MTPYLISGSINDGQILTHLDEKQPYYFEDINLKPRYHRAWLKYKSVADELNLRLPYTWYTARIYRPAPQTKYKYKFKLVPMGPTILVNPYYSIYAALRNELSYGTEITESFIKYFFMVNFSAKEVIENKLQISPLGIISNKWKVKSIMS